MRYNEVIADLRNLTNEEIRPYDMSVATGKSSSTFTYKRDNNGQITGDDLKKIYDYAIEKYKKPPTKNYENKSDDDNIMLDYFPEVEISCGNGIEPLNGRKELITVSKNVIQGFSKAATYTVVNAVSDSMQPEIQPKDLLVVQHYAGEQIKDNHIYIFVYEGALYCKYLSNNLGQIIVKSANADYPTRYIEKEQMDNFYLIGEVKGFIRDYSR